MEITFNDLFMKRILSFVITISVLVLWSSCRKDFSFEASSGNLEFSKDTIYLDTVFTNIGSSTYNLKVYNRSNSDIVIPTLRLTQGETSNYRLNVDGMSGKEFQNVELLAKDSLYIFVETTFNIQSVVAANNQFLYTDAIEFDNGANLQKVELVTLVKDAIFIYPNKNSQGMIETLTFDADGDGVDDETTLQGRFLNDAELTFTNDKPYVIYGYAAVGAGKTLNIDPGARIHFHSNSGLLITDSASLKINGLLSADQDLFENEVIFEGDRMEPIFEDIPGQWGTVWLYSGSVDNQINYATIKNATVGILAENDQSSTNPKLTITNSQIYNSSNFGILGRATSIKAENVVLNKAGQSSFAGTYGGNYNFTHCTIANYWTNSFRQFPALYLNNYITDENNVTFTNDLSEANFNNCIIYGNDNPEFQLDENSGSIFNFKFTNCLLRFENTSNVPTGANYDFNNTDLYVNVIINQDPKFKDAAKNKLRICTDSPVVNLGNAAFAIQVPYDIWKVSRMNAPDLGAYQNSNCED